MSIIRCSNTEKDIKKFQQNLLNIHPSFLDKIFNSKSNPPLPTLDESALELVRKAISKGIKKKKILFIVCDPYFSVFMTSVLKAVYKGHEVYYAITYSSPEFIKIWNEIENFDIVQIFAHGEIRNINEKKESFMYFGALRDTILSPREIEKNLISKDIFCLKLIVCYGGCYDIDNLATAFLNKINKNGVVQASDGQATKDTKSGKWTSVADNPLEFNISLNAKFYQLHGTRKHAIGRLDYCYTASGKISIFSRDTRNYIK